MNNPNGMSEHDTLPKFWADKEQTARDKLKEHEAATANERAWHMYHKKLPMTNVPLSQPLHDKLVRKEKSLYLEQDKWESAYTLLSRTTNDQNPAGKAQIQKYFKQIKPEHKDRHFDGTLQ